MDTIEAPQKKSKRQQQRSAQRATKQAPAAVQPGAVFLSRPWGHALHLKQPRTNWHCGRGRLRGDALSFLNCKASKLGKETAKLVGCTNATDADAIACLRAAPLDTLMNAAEKARGLTPPLAPWLCLLPSAVGHAARRWWHSSSCGGVGDAVCMHD